MKSIDQTPCAFWAEKLAATHPDDLAPLERIALETHIASCQACATVRAEYEAMGRYLEQLPDVKPLPAIPARLLYMWDAQGSSLASTPFVKESEKSEQIATTAARVPRNVHHAPRLRVGAQALVAVLVVVALLGTFLALVALHNRGAITGSGPVYSWKVVPSPGAGTFQNQLGSVDALSSSDAWAVGTSSNGSIQQNTVVTSALIEHWNGRQWSVVRSPKPGDGDYGLEGVAALSSNDAWAVGYSWDKQVMSTLIEHWDGKQWSIVQSPKPQFDQSNLSSIAAVSSNDIWTVGYTLDLKTSASKTLIEHWDGSRWSIVPSPNGVLAQNILYKVAVVSTNDIWTVGYSSNSGYYNSGNLILIEHWDGRQWSIVSGPNLGGANEQILSGLAVVSSNDIWAVGFSTSGSNSSTIKTLIEHWDGSRWSIVSSPNPGVGGNQLNDVVARSSDDVWAVGYSPRSRYPGQESLALVEHWNGKQWSVVKNTDFGTDSNLLYAIAQVPRTGELWAVGTVQVSTFSSSRTLVELYSS
ncbi:MAG TPA: hypothetical protein VFA09_25265 [Ktedonobacteraceae bacterium]|nr:hypothetical protein [Ktedonobacteraceae bacterium]